MDIDVELPLLKEKQEILEKNLELAEKAKQLQDEQRTELEAFLELNEKRNQLDQDYFNLLTQSDEALAEQVDSLMKQLEYEMNRANVKQDVVDKLNEELVQVSNLLLREEEQRKKLAAQLALRQKERNEIRKTADEAAKFSSRVGTLLGLGLEFNQTFVGGLSASFEHFSNLSKAGLSLSTIMSKKLAAAGPKVLGLLATRTEELFIKTDQLTAGFVKATGANDSFRASLQQSIETLRMQGLSYETAGIAATSLYNNTIAFKDASNAARVDIIKYTGTLEQIGVSSADTSRAIQLLSKTLNISGVQAAEESSRLMTLADSLGMAPAQIMSDFSQAASVISAHGADMVNVFAELEAAARATGLQMQDLLGIAAQFDTFDDSAQAVGRLNSLLGGPYLNSIDMVYMSESERNRAMLQAIELSGVSFESMSRLEKRALASAAGINDMAKANEFFQGGLSAYDEAQAKASLHAAEQKKLNALAKEATTIMENLQNAMNAFAIAMTPVIAGVRFLVEGIASLLTVADGIVPKFFAFAAAAKIVSIGVGLLTTVMQSGSIVTGIFTAASSLASGALYVLGAAARFAGGPWYLLAAAVAAAAYHFLPQSPALYQWILWTAGSLVVLGAAGLLSVKGIGLVALAIFGLGLGVMMAGAGVKMMSEGFSKMGELIAGGGGLIAGFAALSIALGQLPFAPAVAAGVAAIATSIYLLSAAINNIDKEILINFRAFTTGLETLPAGGEEFSRMIKSVAEIEPTNVDNVKDIVDHAERYIRTNAEIKVAPFTAVMDAVTAREPAAAATTPTRRTARPDRPVEIVVNMGPQQIRAAGKMISDMLEELPENNVKLRYGVR